MKDKRFKVIYAQGTMDVQRIIVDRQTGVHYLQVSSGYGGGLTVLLDRDGKPVIRTINDDE
nr:DUF6440 family protein [uncultured Caproiciproducens sp.]